MLRLPASLRSAARDLGRLPELADAHRLYASADFTGALRQAERAAEVIGSVPMPAMQVVAGGVLAQVLRATGNGPREASVWESTLGRCGNDDPLLRLHALQGAAACHLHRGDASLAACLCDEAVPLIGSGVSGCGPVASSLGMHRSLARLLQRDSPSATERVALLQADATARADEMLADNDEAVEAAAEGTALLVGDALMLAGDEEGARDAWSALVPVDYPIDGSDDPESPAGRGRTLRDVSARLRLSASWLRAGDVAPARGECTAAADLIEARLSPAHPLLPYALGFLAEAVTAEHEFVAAEGLYRSATDSLLPNGDVGAMTPVSVALTLPTLHGFARLLERLETNDKPRVADAEQMRQRARAVVARHAEALPTSTSAAGDDAWLGIEPWYAAGCEVDWLGACAVR